MFCPVRSDHAARRCSIVRIGVSVVTPSWVSHARRIPLSAIPMLQPRAARYSAVGQPQYPSPPSTSTRMALLGSLSAGIVYRCRIRAKVLVTRRPLRRVSVETPDSVLEHADQAFGVALRIFLDVREHGVEIRDSLEELVVELLVPQHLARKSVAGLDAFDQ